ncbi:MAG: PH domain-containing protein [Balneolaceae bacterium]|nr:PH domain-containing protein [Balneolaceae bacterium]
MTSKARTLSEAEFNPELKKYLNIFGILILFVTVIGIPLIIFWVIIAPYFINKYYERLECELTTRSLRFKKGYIFHTEKNIPLDKIQDLTFKEGPLLRKFGLSIMKIETAGSSGAQGISDLTLIGIVDAANFRTRVLEQRDEVTENVHPTASTDRETTLEVLKEIRDSLQRLEQKLG